MYFSNFFAVASFGREDGYFNLWLNGLLLYFREQNGNTGIRGWWGILYTREQVKASRAEGRKLTATLAAGQRPATQTVPFRLSQDEACYAQGPAQLWQFLEGDGTYVHKSRGGFGLLGLAVVAGTAAGNRARRVRAEREAAPRFRPVDEGTVYVTDKRFVIHGQTQWTDLWFENIRVATCDGTSITFELSGSPPMQLHVWPIDYYFALFHFLAYGDIIEVPPDPV